jgi:hypothetical protein
MLFLVVELSMSTAKIVLWCGWPARSVLVLTEVLLPTCSPRYRRAATIKDRA